MKARSPEHGFALITAILVIVILAVLSMAIVSSSVSNHAQAMQSVDRARSLALAEGAASLLLAELSDDATGPVKNTASYAEDGTGYVRTYTPFDDGDGQARVELYYTQADETGTLVPVTFGTRSNPIDPYSNLRAVVTGIRPTNERSIEIDFTQGFVLFNDAIACDAVSLGTGATNKSLAMLGHIVFNDKGRPGQFYINGDMSANGGVYYGSSAVPLQTETVNNYFSFAGEINADLAGTDAQLEDYTNPGSTDQLFDFDRVIAACRAGSGQEYTTYSQFVNAMNAANAGNRCLEGITVLSIDTATWGDDHMRIEDIPDGINIRGTLVFNFKPGTPASFKIWVELPFNINAADLSGLDPADPSTYTTGYYTPYKNKSKMPSKAKIAPEYANFTDEDDLPALMFNTGIVDQHGASNICGVIYGPAFVELENLDGNIQYFNGAILGGSGVYVMGNATAGYTVIAFDPNTIDLLATRSNAGKGLRVQSWRTLR